MDIFLLSSWRKIEEFSSINSFILLLSLCKYINRGVWLLVIKNMFSMQFNLQEKSYEIFVFREKKKFEIIVSSSLTQLKKFKDVISVGLIVLGAFIAGARDLSFDFYGYAVVFLANIATAIYLATIARIGSTYTYLLFCIFLFHFLFTSLTFFGNNFLKFSFFFSQGSPVALIALVLCGAMVIFWIITCMPSNF